MGRVYALWAPALTLSLVLLPQGLDKEETEAVLRTTRVGDHGAKTTSTPLQLWQP